MVGGVPPRRAGSTMNEALDQLARAYGILSDYVSETGERRIISDDAKRRLLAVMGVPVATEQEVEAALKAARSLQSAMPEPPARCYFPSWLDHARVWGVSCQLYGLRSV